MDTISIARQISEKTKEYDAAVHFNFVDFKLPLKQCGGKHIGVSGKRSLTLSIICIDICVTINGKLYTCWFEKWYLLYPKLFNIFLEFILKEIESMSDDFELTDESLTTSVKYADDT